MVQIKPFVVEEWMARLETTPGSLNVAETCCDSVSVQDLQNFSSTNDVDDPLDLAATRLTYGDILGSNAVRKNITKLYNDDTSEDLASDHVVLTQGAIMANFLLLYTLVGPGDHVICVYPTYEQLYEVPKSLGAEVTLWHLKEENVYVPNVTELESLARVNTKVIFHSYRVLDC